MSIIVEISRCGNECEVCGFPVYIVYIYATAKFVDKIYRSIAIDGYYKIHIKWLFFGLPS